MRLLPSLITLFLSLTVAQAAFSAATPQVPQDIRWLRGGDAPEWAVAAIGGVFPRSVAGILKNEAIIGIAGLGGSRENPALVVLWTGKDRCNVKGCAVEIIGHRRGQYQFLGSALRGAREIVSLGNVGASGWRDLLVGGRRLSWSGAGYEKAGTNRARTPDRYKSQLFALTKRGDVPRLRKLLRRGIDPDLRDKNLLTPLMLTVASGRKQVASLLITAGARVDARGVGDVTPLHAAAVNGQFDMAAMLIANGADTAVRTVHRETPLHWAVSSDVRLIPLLAANGVPVNALDRNGRTALHLAAMKGNRDGAIALLGEGADRTLRDNNSESPAELAARHEHWELVTVFRDADFPTRPLSGTVNARPLLSDQTKRGMSRHLANAWRRNRVWSYRKAVNDVGAGSKEAPFAKALLQTAEAVRRHDLRGARGYVGRLVRIDRASDRLVIAFDNPVQLPGRLLSDASIGPISEQAFYPTPLIEGGRVELYGGLQRSGADKGQWLTVHVRMMD